MSNLANPPAFPTDPGAHQHGMTLRDYFAGQALHNILGGGHKPNYDVAAADAYRYADAMLEARTP